MSDTTTEFKIGDRVRVSAEAANEDVYFGGEVEGVVVPEPDDYAGRYPKEERRVFVEAWSDDWDTVLQQWVKPKHLTLINE